VIEQVKPINTFGDLVLIFALALAALVVASIPAFSITIARPIIGTIAVLFVPGYAFIAALFPKKATLAIGVRLGFSFGVSIVIVPLLEIALNYTQWGIRLGPTLVVLVVFTLVCVIVAGVRRHQLPPEKRLSVNWPVWHQSDDREADWLAGSRFDRMLSIALVIAIIASVAVASYALVMPKPSDHFTEFYLLGANGTLGNYTTDLTAGVLSPVTVGIINHEARDVTYELVVSANNSTQRSTVYSEKVTIPDGQQWEKQIDLIINQLGDNVKLNFALYADPPTADPYRDTHIWVNVTA
jgi:Predicted membrane protein